MYVKKLCKLPFTSKDTQYLFIKELTNSNNYYKQFELKKMENLFFHVKNAKNQNLLKEEKKVI